MTDEPIEINVADILHAMNNGEVVTESISSKDEEQADLAMFYANTGNPQCVFANVDPRCDGEVATLEAPIGHGVMEGKVIKMWVCEVHWPEDTDAT
jgi:ribosomal protein S5